MNKQGLVPIWTRITIDGKRAELSIQKQIYPKHWDNENAVAAKGFSEAISINDYLTLIKVILSDTIIYFVTLEDVKNSYKGVKEIKKTFLQLFKQFNQQLAERKEIDDLSEGRYNRFEIFYGKCEVFIKREFLDQKELGLYIKELPIVRLRKVRDCYRGNLPHTFLFLKFRKYFLLCL